MAQFGQIGSAFTPANALYDAAGVDRAVQGYQRNALAMDSTRQQMGFQAQDQQQQTYQRDAQARIGMARELSNLPEPEAAAQWGSYRQRLQASGLGQGLPEQWPGMERIKAVAASDLTTFQRMQVEHQQRQDATAAAGSTIGFGPGGGGMATPVSAPANGPMPAANSSEPRGIRNNNPLNLSFANQPGASMEQHATPRFARFETPEAGIAASVNQLRLYQSRGNNTLAGMINTWAPPSENDTRGYVQRVAQATGLDPNQPVNLDDPAVAARLVQAMAHVETGRPLDAGVASRGVAGRTGGTDVAGPGVAAAPAAGAEPRMLYKGNAPFTDGLPSGQAWGQGANGQRVAMNIPGARQPRGAGDGAESNGPLAGNGLDNQLLNVLLTGDPGTPLYAAAFAKLGEERMMANGQWARPDMSPYRAPTARPPGVMEPPAAGARSEALAPAGPAPAAPPDATQASTAPAAPAVSSGAGPALPQGGRSYGQAEVRAPAQGQVALSPALIEMRQETEDKLAGLNSARTALADALRLSPRAYAGPTAETRGKVAGSTGFDTATATATTQFNSIMTEQALSQLRSIFGGNPTEGERKILVEMQASTEMSRDAREALITRAQQAVDQRVAAQQSRLTEIRRGTYGRADPNYTPPPVTAPQSLLDGAQSPPPGSSARPPGSSARPPADPLEGRTITNGATGERMIRRGGKWEPAQ